MVEQAAVDLQENLVSDFTLNGHGRHDTAFAIEVDVIIAFILDTVKTLAQGADRDLRIR